MASAQKGGGGEDEETGLGLQQTMPTDLPPPSPGRPPVRWVFPLDPEKRSGGLIARVSTPRLTADASIWC